MTEELLGIEHQTVFVSPLVEFVDLAGNRGCGHVAIALEVLAAVFGSSDSVNVRSHRKWL
jgi:hypothetical protein